MIIVRSIFLLVVLIVSVSTNGEVYKCIDEHGELKFQDMECGINEKSEKMDLRELDLKTSIIGNADVGKRYFDNNLVRNAGFDKNLEFWVPEREPPAFGWVDNDGHRNGGALSIQSAIPDNPKENRIYESVLSQCIKLDDGRRYRFAASFKAVERYKSAHANRVNLYWYQSEDCSTRGQFAEYLEPDKDAYGWQRVSHDNSLRSLNAKAALISIVQSRTAGNNGLVYWDDIELNPIEKERGESENLVLSQKYTLPIRSNYVVNGDFQHSLNSWNYSGDTKWIPHEGGDAPGAARLAIFSDRGGYGAHGFSQCINIGANKVFSAGTKVKVDPVSSQKGGGIFRLNWYEKLDCSGRNQAGFIEDRVENIDGWQQLLIDRIEAPPGAQSATLYFTRGVDDSGLFAYFIDDVYFMAVPDEEGR